MKFILTCCLMFNAACGLIHPHSSQLFAQDQYNDKEAAYLNDEVQILIYQTDGEKAEAKNNSSFMVSIWSAENYCWWHAKSASPCQRKMPTI